MNTRVLLWAPRVAGLALAAFFAMFALGAFQTSHSIVDVVMHFAPALLMVAMVALGWRRPWLAGVGMLALAILYAAITRRLDWALVIGGPLVIAALLYLASWRVLKRSALVAVLTSAMASPSSAQAPQSFVQLDGSFAIPVFSRGSTRFDSNQGTPVSVANLPAYVGWDVMAMRKTDSTHALGVSLHAGVMLGFMGDGSSDFLMRSGASLRRRTWMSADAYRDMSVGLLVAQVEKLRDPSGLALRPGINASVTWARKRVGFFTSMDIVHADVEPRFALHAGLRITGAKPVLAATAIGAALAGLFNMPI